MKARHDPLAYKLVRLVLFALAGGAFWLTVQLGRGLADKWPGFDNVSSISAPATRFRLQFWFTILSGFAGTVLFVAAWGMRWDDDAKQ